MFAGLPENFYNLILVVLRMPKMDGYPVQSPLS